MRVAQLVLLALAIAQEGPGTAPASPSPEKKVIDGVAAIVNNEVITRSELESRLEPARKSFGYKDPYEWERFVRETLVTMVWDKLFAQAARRATLDQERIDRDLQRVMEEAEKAAGGRIQLIEKLQQMGRTYEEFKRERRIEIESRDWTRYELGFIGGSSGRPNTEIHVTPGEMRQYYKTHEKDFLQSEAVRGRQIFLAIDTPMETESVQKKAESLLASLRTGEDFVKLAQEHSDWKPKEGGDLGWVERENSPFEKTLISFLFANRPGTVSDVLVLRNGFAIAKVEEHRERKLRSFEEAQIEVWDKIMRERHAEKVNALQLKLVREAYVWPEDLLPR